MYFVKLTYCIQPNGSIFLYVDSQSYNFKINDLIFFPIKNDFSFSEICIIDPCNTFYLYLLWKTKVPPHTIFFWNRVFPTNIYSIAHNVYIGSNLKLEFEYELTTIFYNLI